MVRVLLVFLGLAALGPGLAAAAGPTDIVRVDDGYPQTVHFHLRDGRVRGIEWNFGSAE